MAIMPMAPALGQDHAVTPTPPLNQLYADYGPLFKLMRGVEWYLKSSVPVLIDEIGDSVEANAFVDKVRLIIDYFHLIVVYILYETESDQLYNFRTPVDR